MAGATNKPNSVDKGTLAVSVITLLVTGFLGWKTFSVDAQLKAVQTNLTAAQSRLAEYQARGAVNIEYRAVPVTAFCAAEADAPSVRAQLRYFVQNEVMNLATREILKTCGWETTPQPTIPFNPNGIDIIADGSELFIVFLQLTSRSADFEPAVSLRVKTVPLSGRLFIWMFRDMEGSESVIQLGQLKKDERIYLPVALMRDRIAEIASVLVPLNASWKSPLLNEPVTEELRFVTEGPWRGTDALEMLLTSSDPWSLRIGQNMKRTPAPGEPSDPIEYLDPFNRPPTSG